MRGKRKVRSYNVEHDAERITQDELTHGTTTLTWVRQGRQMKYDLCRKNDATVHLTES